MWLKLAGLPISKTIHALISLPSFECSSSVSGRPICEWMENNYLYSTHFNMQYRIILIWVVLQLRSYNPPITHSRATYKLLLIVVVYRWVIGRLYLSYYCIIGYCFMLKTLHSQELLQRYLLCIATKCC